MDRFWVTALKNVGFALNLTVLVVFLMKTVFYIESDPSTDKTTYGR
jgi:hypothetical protein